jgi:hypothetical protein
LWDPKKNPLSLAALRALREEFARTVIPAQALASEARSLEMSISDLVNAAYGLTTDEIKLMWETAPPRMPISSGDYIRSNADSPTLPKVYG